MARIKLTKKSVDALPYAEKAQTLYWDTELKGFGLLVSKQSKSYIAQKDVHGRAVRTTIGRSTLFSAELARDRAREILRSMSLGENPNRSKTIKKQKRCTLDDAFREYVATRGKSLAAGTLIGYEDFMENHFHDWSRTALQDVTRDMIIVRYAAITNASGAGAATNAMRFLRALYNFKAIDDDQIQNPVRILSLKKLWHKSKRRSDVIKTKDLNSWYASVGALQNETFRDALIVLLFTGLRKMEAFTLEWENVDFKNETVHVDNTKSNVPITLPVCKTVLDILNARRQTAGESPWVFQGTGAAGHIVDASAPIRTIRRDCGVSFSLHTLRRTFITTAERLNISPYTIKRLVNHSTANDVTSGYIVIEPERLREPVNSIEEELLRNISALER